METILGPSKGGGLGGGLDGASDYRVNGDWTNLVPEKTESLVGIIVIRKIGRSCRSIERNCLSTGGSFKDGLSFLFKHKSYMRFTKYFILCTRRELTKGVACPPIANNGSASAAYLNILNIN